MKPSSLVAVVMSGLVATTVTDGTADADVPVGREVVSLPGRHWNKYELSWSKSVLPLPFRRSGFTRNTVILRQGRSK
jgi:hypothetical protein